MESAAATAAGRHDNAGTELYRSLLDPCPAPVLVAREGFITYANPAARTMLRADSVQLLGFPLLSLAPSRFEEAFRTYLEAAAATSEPRPFLNAIFQRFDGSLAFVEITAWLVSSDSAPALAISFSPSREREFETLAEHAPDLIARFDRQCRHLYVNPVIARITGISRDAFLGRTLAEAGVPPDESELWDSKLGEAFEAKRETTFECGFTGPNGTILLQAKLVPECNADGEVVTVASVARDITAEKAGETELRRAKARISDILASMTESFIALDRDWRIVYVSRRVQERLGQPLLGRDLWEVVPEARETAFWTGYHRVMEERIPLAFEVCYPNGEWYEVHAAPTEEGLSAYVLNITERKRIEDALRESEEQRRLALEVARVGSYDWDLRRGLIRLDARCREFCGLEQETVEPREILARIHPSDRRAVEVGLARSLDPSGRGEAQLEFRILLPEGHTRWVLLRARTVFRSVFKDDGAVRQIGAVLDFTERRLAEKALERSEVRYRSLIDATASLVWTTDASGVFVELQPSWEQYTGQKWPEYTSMGGMSVVHPEDRPMVEDRWRRSIETGEPFEVELRLFHAPTREYRQALSRGVPVRNEDGSLREWVGTVTDIDERKKAEEALRASNEALRRANADLEQFAYAAAHDLQEPIRNVALYTQWLARRYGGRLDDQADQFISTIIEGARRMHSLVQGLLSYTGVVGKHAGAEGPASSDAGEVLDAVIANLRTAIAEHQARIARSALPVVAVQNVHLMQLFQNLIGNALKYRSEAVPEIHIEAEPCGPDWIFTVRDNGIGIASEHHERIFGIFKRLHGRRVPGTGIGLAICQRIVSHYGGRIWVESEPGRGASFRFTLPGASDATGP